MVERNRPGPRLARLDRIPPVRLILATDLVTGPSGRGVWRDGHARLAGLRPAVWSLFKPLLGRLGVPGADGDPAVIEAGLRPSVVQVARRLALSSTAVAALRGIAAQPLLTTLHLARLLDTDERQARRHLAMLRSHRLIQGSSDGVYATQAGMTLLAGVAGLPTADYRRLTATAGGRLPRPGGRRGTRALGLLAHHRRHTQGVTILRLNLKAAVDGWRGHPAVRLVKWEGPACRPVSFATDDPRLVRWRPGWSRDGRGDIPEALGKVEPDAVSWLAVGDGRDQRTLKLLIELDYATEGPRRLARKLRHYAGWAENLRGGQALLFVVPTPTREHLVHRVMATAEVCFQETVPLLTTSFDLLASHGPLGAIWWNGRTNRRCSFLDVARQWR